jgi:hypothetical protein
MRGGYGENGFLGGGGICTCLRRLGIPMAPDCGGGTVCIGAAIGGGIGGGGPWHVEHDPISFGRGASM